MEITLTTPAILFSTVSLLYVAYTTRFVAISNLIRNLKTRFENGHEEAVLQQIKNLKVRVLLIRNMQLSGIIALIVSSFSMVFIYVGKQDIGFIFFGISLLFLIYSMLLAAREVLISVHSLSIELDSIEELKNAEIDDASLIAHNFKKIKKVTKDLFEQEEIEKK
ncbi:MAG TPA: DUF2721 domain-containing protein [Chitinophagales bacterium]|nr:DUF2721 domain-containing protein [Chitinophagales bacterium]HMW11607.1 DUF2721 domain-containing protein [Chitinophagales bacterium]HMX60982.1 DUF2721 domain-containing protein [Chitinophagales bacterium]HMY23115.1 DUF2721 domain-containing protein [Chitinophagales bacterium]HMZ32642.1 DUF2721 domain-containing protein [Chitinophagales bacterium]